MIKYIVGNFNIDNFNIIKITNIEENITDDHESIQVIGDIIDITNETNFKFKYFFIDDKGVPMPIDDNSKVIPNYAFGVISYNINNSGLVTSPFNILNIYIETENILTPEDCVEKYGLMTNSDYEYYKNAEIALNKSRNIMSIQPEINDLDKNETEDEDEDEIEDFDEDDDEDDDDDDDEIEDLDDGLDESEGEMA